MSNGGLPQPLPSAHDYYNLGTYHRPITTTKPEAQTWFDRGLIWSYAFNHEEAARCFEQALVHDPQCAMAHWGLAYCLGPSYNKPWEFFDEKELGSVVARTYHAVEQAKLHSIAASAAEQDLISALQKRYPQDEPVQDCSIWNADYAKAMKLVWTEHPEDLDIIALYVDSLMNLTPWALWDLHTGSPSEHAKDAKSILESILTDHVSTHLRGISHPGLLHLYIHLMEMSPTPEAALPLANHLRGLVPDSGHLNHMPTHLDILCGDYQSAMTWNGHAIAADEKYLSRSGPLNFYTLYRCHDYHFRIYAAMFAGNYSIAIATVDQLEGSLPESLLRVDSPPMADWLESFLSVRIHVLIRFGRWDELLTLSFPADTELYCVTTALTHYGYGIAYAAINNVAAAEQEQLHFKAAVEKVQPSRTLFNNKCTDLLAIASAMLDGEICYRRQDFETAFSHLRHAIELDENLPYDEPWGWMQPTRHAYGALLLEQGVQQKGQKLIEEAAAVYSADLGFDHTLPRPLRHPNNVWALSGYEECMQRLGREEERARVREMLEKAKDGSDVEVKSSCFCRRGT